MKLIIVFLLISTTLFAQNSGRNAMHNLEAFNILIKGDWHLTQVEIVDGYNVFSDTNRFISQETRNKKITITSDSIYNHRDTTLRYYVRNQNFSYKIQYDSIMHSNNLKLYSSGKRRKLLEEESYEIINCTIDELVIKSSQYLNNSLDYTSISIVYTFRKNGVTDLLKEISGNWFYYSDRSNSFMSEKDTLTYEFIRTSNDSICQKSDNHVDLEFIRKNYENVVNVALYGELMGVYAKTKFSFDPINNLVYFRTKNKTLVYNFKLAKKEKLILSLNEEKTQEINTLNKR